MKPRIRSTLFVFLCLLAGTSLACTLTLFELPTFPAGPTVSPVPVVPSATPLPKAQTTFTVVLPEPLLAGESVALSVLDEVTGLALNATMFPMQARDNLTYTALLALPANSVVKYRYVRRTNFPVIEDAALKAPIRYRLYSVIGPGEVQDLIASWNDKAYSRPTGSVQGRVLNTDTGAPVPNILVTAGGLQSLTDSGGRFDLQGLPVGTHNVVAYSLDGLYQTFQQGATVASGVNTAVEIRVKSAPLVHVTFNVSVPRDTVQGAPVRLAGNLIELGNSFADLAGGTSTVPDRMPVLSFQPDGTYRTTISLPVGTFVQYKYTLGDGFWNAEHRTSGEFVLHELVVPAQDIVINDSVSTWQAGPSSPILFEVTVPSITPAGDLIYIQFNPYGWTQPIPMWPMGNNHWAYKLYGPLNMLGTFRYRYCRNGQCNSADDLSTAGDSASGREVATSIAGQDILDSVDGWAWLEHTEPNTLVGSPITPRPSGFISGVEFQSTFQPNWSYYDPQAIQNVQALGANWIMLTPSWTYGSTFPLNFAPVPGKDPFWLDSAITISQARAANLNVAIFPGPHFTGTSAEFWKSAPRDSNWWQNWFDHYRAFAVNYADLASQTGAQALILGGDWLSPALPNGTLADGSAPGAPPDSDLRWKAILVEVRQHFNGRLLWALPYTPGKLQTSLNFLQDTDGIYLLWNAPLATRAGASKLEMANEAGRLLDNEISPLPAILNKTIILAIAYPSVSDAPTGCLKDGRGGCFDWSALNQPANLSTVSIDLKAQSDLYEAMLTAINSRPWVGGVVSRGYYPPAMLQDKSASVHGKPAADLLWYWFPRLTGVVK